MIGGAAMKVEQKMLLEPNERTDPPPKKLVEKLAVRRGTALSERQAMAAGMGVHMGYSAFWGALFGVVQDRLTPPSACTVCCSVGSSTP